MLKFGAFIIQNSKKINSNLFDFCKKSIFGIDSSLRNFRPGILHPHGYSFDWAIKAAIPNNEIYTEKPLPKIKTGGRGPNGRIEIKFIGGGLKMPHFKVSKYRGGLSNGSEKVVSEKILYIHKNWWRSENIALVARGMQKRWIYATTSMKVGDIINSHSSMKSLIGKVNPGDAYPIGSLPVGMQVCQIEQHPGQGAHHAIKAGTQGILHQKLSDNSCIVKFGKKLLKISPYCSVVVGQMSNPDHNKKKFRKFGELRWLGLKQRSGLRQKKTGRFGRKIRKPKPPVDYTFEETENIKGRIVCSKPGYPAAIKKPGTFENPVHIKPIPLEEGEIHPPFRWCSWSIVR